MSMIGATVAFADEASGTDATTPTTNDITISAPGGGSQNLIAPTVKGRTFKAYQLGKYKDVEGKDGVITSYDLDYGEKVNGITDAMLDKALIAAYPTGLKDLMTVSGDKVTFTGTAANMNRLQFICHYMYGSGTDVYGNTQVNSNELRKFAESMKTQLSSATPTATATAEDSEVTLDIPDGSEGLYLIVENDNDETKDPVKQSADGKSSETISHAMIVGTPVSVDGTMCTQIKSGTGDSAVTYDLGKLNLKAEKVEIQKTVSHPEQLIQIGTKRTFTINTNVPNYQNYQADHTTTDDKTWIPKEFKITDNPTDNIEPFTKDTSGKVTGLNNFSLEASTDGSTYTKVPAYDYAFSENTDTADDTNDFIVSLNPSATVLDDSGQPVKDADGNNKTENAILKYQGQRIKLTYDGVITALTPDAKDSLKNTENDVQLDFSNNPNVEEDKGTVTDKVKLYSVKLDMQKADLNAPKTLLSGAKFQVTVPGADASAEPTKIKFAKSADGSTYSVVKAGAAGYDKALDTITLDYKTADGAQPVTIAGLAADNDKAITYTFKETEAPKGYVLGSNPVTFTVTLTPQITKDENGNVVKDKSGVNIAVDAGEFNKFVDKTATLSATSAAADNTFDNGTITVLNTKNVSDLPKTGGQITWILLGGAAVIALAVALGYVGRKMRKGATA